MCVQKRKCSDWHVESYKGFAIHHNSRYTLQPISSAQAHVSGNSNTISKMSSALVSSSGFKKTVGFLLHYFQIHIMYREETKHNFLHQSLISHNSKKEKWFFLSWHLTVELNKIFTRIYSQFIIGGKVWQHSEFKAEQRYLKQSVNVNRNDLGNQEEESQSRQGLGQLITANSSWPAHCGHLAVDHLATVTLLWLFHLSQLATPILSQPTHCGTTRHGQFHMR